MEAGTKVGAGRWPYAAAHPGCWQTPWVGTVLRQDDPCVWKGSIAFGNRTPTQAETTAHVAWCHAQGLLKDEAPVLWDFGKSGLKVHWERTTSLRSVAQDLAEWHREREARFTELLADRKAA